MKCDINKSILKPKPLYTSYEQAQEEYFELLNKLEEFLVDDKVYYFFANKKRVKRAEIFLNFLDYSDLLNKLKIIYEHKNPMVGFLYYINAFNSKMISEYFDRCELFNAFLNNDNEAIMSAIRYRIGHYELDKLNYYDTPNKIRNVLTLFNMINDNEFRYEKFKTTKYDLEHVHPRSKKSSFQGINKLKNILLLDAKTNRGYKNKDFEGKAKYVHKKYKLGKIYYLYATKKTFLYKGYGEIWDGELYLNEIKESLSSFVKV